MAVELGIKETFKNEEDRKVFLDLVSGINNALANGTIETFDAELKTTVKQLAKKLDYPNQWLFNKTVRIAKIMRSDVEYNL